MPKRVLVVDDNAEIRHALCKLFTAESDFEVCGEAENGREAMPVFFPHQLQRQMAMLLQLLMNRLPVWLWPPPHGFCPD